jgi:hypothetical protein
MNMHYIGFLLSDIAKVIPIEGEGNVLRLEDLIVTNGSDLYVYLPTDKSASDFIDLGRLKANIGNQNYPIPLGTDMSVIFKRFSLWAQLKKS